MKTMSAILTGVFLAVMAVCAEANVVEIEPSSAVILPNDNSGLTRVAMKFNISAVEVAEGWEIVTAHIDWPISGMTVEEPTTFLAYGLTGAWTAEGAGSGQTELACEVDPASRWEMGNLDYTRLGGLVRLDILGLVNQWLASPEDNFGVVITFENMSAQDLSGKLGAAKLVVRYVYHLTPAQ